MDGMGQKIRTLLKLPSRQFQFVMRLKKSLSKPSIFILAAGLYLTGGILRPFHFHSVAQLGTTSVLSTLPLTFPAQSSELIEYFNDIARPNDIVSLPKQFLPILSEIKAGQTMVAFASWEEAEAIIPSIQTEIEWVLYNPEHWDHTPTSEQQNLPATVQNAAQFLHDRGLLLFLAPNRRFIDEALEDIAPLADALLLQGQRLQDDPDFFASWITEKIEVARTANPNILIYVQVGANRGTPEVMLHAIQTVADQIDGIAIWSQPRTLENLQAFINLLRPDSQVLSAETDYPSKTSLPPTASDLVPTLTPTPGGQWIPIMKFSPICAVVVVVFLGVLGAILAFQFWRHRSGSA